MEKADTSVGIHPKKPVTTAKKIQEKLESRHSVRMNAEDRRQQILDVAMQLFSQKGFRGTTAKEIALAAGVNEAIIFRHFATKSELYSAIMDQKASSAEVQALENVMKKAMEAKDDKTVFESIAFHIMEFHRRDDTALRTLMYSALEGHELAEMIFRNHIAKTHLKLAEYVERRIADGGFRQVEPMMAVRGFMGAVMGHVMFYKFFPHDARELLDVSSRQAAERFTDLFLASMTNFEYDPQRQDRK